MDNLFFLTFCIAPNLLLFMIYIYDNGVHNNTALMLALQMVNNKNVQFCTATMIENECLTDAKILIMPGGADLYYCEKLNGRGNQIIREFVANGGSYLGICAGAYYACSRLDWHRGEIGGKRELDFWNGCATGPVYNWVENSKSLYDGSWIKAAEIKTDNGLRFLTQYNGGPIFDKSTDKIDIIARYTELKDTPPAIIGGQFGKGKYILSSPHIENFGHLLTDRLYRLSNKSYNREKAEIDKLLHHETVQKEFFKNIIDRLL